MWSLFAYLAVKSVSLLFPCFQPWSLITSNGTNSTSVAQQLHTKQHRFLHAQLVQVSVQSIREGQGRVGCWLIKKSSCQRKRLWSAFPSHTVVPALLGFQASPSSSEVPSPAWCLLLAWRSLSCKKLLRMYYYIVSCPQSIL